MTPTPREDDARLFPIMKGPDIPWSLIAPYEHRAQANHYQSLKRLAERGGLGMCEAMAVMQDRPWHRMPSLTVEDFLDFIANRRKRAALRETGTEPGWRDPKELPRNPGTKIMALVESEMEYRRGEPMFLTHTGYHRIGDFDRIVGWRTAAPSPHTPDGGERHV